MPSPVLSAATSHDDPNFNWARVRCAWRHRVTRVHGAANLGRPCPGGGGCAGGPFRLSKGTRTPLMSALYAGRATPCNNGADCEADCSRLGLTLTLSHQVTGWQPAPSAFAFPARGDTMRASVTTPAVNSARPLGHKHTIHSGGAVLPASWVQNRLAGALPQRGLAADKQSAPICLAEPWWPNQALPVRNLSFKTEPHLQTST